MERGRLSWPERGWLWFRLGVRLVGGAVCIWLAAVYGGRLLALSAPFVAAMAAAALLDPAVRRLQRRLGWSRQVLTGLVLVLAFGLLGAAVLGLAWLAGSELSSLIQNWEVLLDGLRETLTGLEALVRRLSAQLPPQLNAPLESMGAALLDWLSGVTPGALNGLLSYTTEKAMALPSLLVGLTMFVMAAWMLTADWPYMRTRTIQRLGDSALSLGRQLRTVALGAFGGYLRAQMLLSAGVFFILLTGFLLVRQPYALLLALALAVLDFIPIVGAGTVMVPWAVIALVTRNYPAAIRMMSIWGVIALFRRVMEPKFVGEQTGLPPILALVSIYAGMKLAGVLGMVLAPILVLIALNLSGMGMLRGLRRDLEEAARDLRSIFGEDV